MGKLILLILILAFIALGIYSYLDPSGSDRLWAPVKNYISTTEESSVFRASEAQQNQINNELDKIRQAK